MGVIKVALLVLFCVALSHQQCTTQTNTNYNTAGNLVTLYKVPSTQACSTACLSFEECTRYSYTQSNQQCVVKTNVSSVVSGTSSGIDSGVCSRTYTRPIACPGTVESNTDYYLPANLGSASSSSSSDCCAKCAAVPGCNYWTLASGTCWFKANLGKKTTSSGVSSGTVIPTSVKNTAKRTGKKGLAVYGTNSCSDIQKLNKVSWVYNWAETPGVLEECYLKLGIQFVPMVWGLSSNLDIIYADSPYLLTFNEPNFPQESNMSPQQAANAWPQIQAVAAKYGMQIGSPSASYGGSNMDPIAWLDQFFSLCTGCKVDFINTHQYDCRPYDLYGAITNFEKYNKPLWVTEFSCYNGPSVDSEVTFVNTIVPLFEGDAKIARYSYFGTRSAGGSTMDLFNSTISQLTPVGTAYITK